LDRHPLTRTKILALGTAMLMMVVGLVIGLTTDRPPPPASELTSTSDPPPESPHSDGGLLGRGFAPTGPSAPDGGPAEPVPTTDSSDEPFSLRDISPFMVKGGLGLFVGFAIGFAIRAFLRLAVVIVGFYLLILSLMAYAGWVEIHWNLMENQISHLLPFLSGQFDSFQTFLTGAIPASTLTAVGFAVGLRRK
jgi:uncharacterized membrane protein (Fun14 family)